MFETPTVLFAVKKDNPEIFVLWLIIICTANNNVEVYAHFVTVPILFVVID